MAAAIPQPPTPNPGLSSAEGPQPPTLIDDLKVRARQVRRDILEMTTAAGSGHPGGSLSCVEILVALFFARMRHDPRNPRWEERDRFILSKGHAAPALYAVLAQAGYFPREDLLQLRRLGSHLQGHPDQRLTPGVEVSSGSLGNGFSFAQGVALAGKLDQAPWRVYALISDGEMDEGQIWEAALFAAHHGLDNLTGIVDVNGLQNDGFVNDILVTEPVVDKWRSFGWNALEVDGHDLGQILEALEVASPEGSGYREQETGEAAQVSGVRFQVSGGPGPRPPTPDPQRGRPTMIVCRTVKGKGVSFMENNPDFHGKAPTSEQLAQALAELGFGG